MSIQIIEGTIMSNMEASNNVVQHARFEELYKLLKKEVPFNSEWNNGTGYMNGAVSDKTMKELPCGMYKSVDDIGRKVIIVKGTNAVSAVFERYPEASLIKKVVLNTPYSYTSGISRKQQEEVLGYDVNDHTNPVWNVVDVIRYLLAH